MRGPRPHDRQTSVHPSGRWRGRSQTPHTRPRRPSAPGRCAVCAGASILVRIVGAGHCTPTGFDALGDGGDVFRVSRAAVRVRPATTRASAKISRASDQSADDNAEIIKEMCVVFTHGRSIGGLESGAIIADVCGGAVLPAARAIARAPRDGTGACAGDPPEPLCPRSWSPDCRLAAWPLSPLDAVSKVARPAGFEPDLQLQAATYPAELRARRRARLP